MSYVTASRARVRRLAGMLAGLALALGAASIAPAAAGQSNAHVYVLTGLLNMSPGLETLAEKVRHSGIPATVSNHSFWSARASEAIAQYKSGKLRSIVIIGHSMGGGAAVDMATELGQAGVPVDLVITIDPTGTTAVPPNVRRAVDYYVAGGVGSPMTGKARGAIQNIADRSATHFTIIAAHERQMLSAVLSAARSHQVTATAPQAQAAPAN
jgi:pimeloyl-ACP methyl ester carboxylesterase